MSLISLSNSSRGELINEVGSLTSLYPNARDLRPFKDRFDTVESNYLYLFTERSLIFSGAPFTKI